MARVTVEDCTKVVPNRFELVLLAAQRARDISAGQDATIDPENDKNAVVALREIAQNNIELEDLKANIVRGVNRHDVSVSEDEKLASLQAESDEAVLSEDQVGDLSFTELEQEAEAPALSEDSVLAAAEDLFAEED
tara:strand:- start:1966 stop:2373 length:408 start_codon:yes stop_codon:yes gene_type:complete